MATETSVALLKTSLGRAGTLPKDIEELMASCLDAATIDLERDGIAVDEDNPADRNLLVMYARWLYQKRDTGEGKSRMLREAINDRKVSDATGGAR